MRRTGKELTEFMDKYLKSVGKTFADVSRGTGIKKELFSMWKSHPTIIPKLDVVILISEYMGITVSQLIGQEKTIYSESLIGLIKMLEVLSPSSIQSVSAVAKTFYDIEVREKNSIG